MAGDKGNDGLLLFMFLMAVIWGGGWLVWKAFKPQLTQGLFAVRTAEVHLADIWMSDDDIIKVPIPAEVNDEGPLKAKLGDNEHVEYRETTFGKWKTFILNAEYKDITPEHIRVSTYVVMYCLRIPIVVILAAMFLWCLFNGPTSHFRKTLGLETLMEHQSRTFSVIKPFLNFNPNTLKIRPPGSPVPTELPMFAEALSPEEWLAINEIEMKDNMPDRTTSERAFAKQLGPRWKGVNDLPNDLKVLLACFCLKASRKRNEADDLLGRLACCWDHKSGLNLSRDRKLLSDAKKILKDKKLSEKVIGNCNRHAYITTAMMRALNTAREEGGVLAPATFVWLRAHNRGLWYPLNNLGRQAFHMEALGVCAHYRAEKQINRPIPKPRVMDAVDGLIEFQSNPIMVRPLPEVDYGPSGKKPKSQKAA